MKNALIVLLIIFITISIRVCVRYEPQNYYYAYADIDIKNLFLEKISRILISNDKIEFISSEKISEDLFLEKISISVDNIEIGEVKINHKINENTEEISYLENENVYVYYISDDIMKILGEDFKKIKKDKDEYLQVKEVDIFIFLKNHKNSESYKIAFNNTRLSYQKKGFDIWIPDR